MKHQLKPIICNALLAGFMVGLGCITYCYTSTTSTILASFLFSLALLSVIVQQHQLFTGKIGYANLKSVSYLLTIYVCNIAAVVGFCLLFSYTRIFPDLTVRAIEITAVKTNDNLLSMFILAIGCGMMMYLAVDNYKKTKHPLFVIIPIMFFILTGFEHCIADAGYYALAHAELDGALILTILTVTIGNSVGSIALYRLNL